MANDGHGCAQVAREALQTALIQSQASIVRLEMPAEATHFPGLPGGSRVEGTAVIADPGTPWFGGDEGPISCGESFSHLEIEPASEGIGFFVTAWNNVVECGQPQGGLYQEFPEPAPFTLPDLPGLYPVVLGQPGDSTTGPILLVEQGEACPAEPPPLDTCATGFLFAECGGALPPAIFCTAQDAPLPLVLGRLPGRGVHSARGVRPDGPDLPGVRHRLGPRALEPGAGHGAPIDRRPGIPGARRAERPLHVRHTAVPGRGQRTLQRRPDRAIPVQHARGD